MESRVRPLLRPYLSLLIIIARDIVPNPTGINSMIEDVNSTMVKPDEILSDHAYLYLSDRTSLVCESDF